MPDASPHPAAGARLAAHAASAAAHPAKLTLRALLTPEMWGLDARYILRVTLATAEVLLAYCVLRFLIRAAIQRVFRPLESYAHAQGGEREARVRTLHKVAQSVAGYALFFVAALTLLSTFHVNTGSVLATASIVGVAVGFGSQKLVRDVISGFFILLEDQFAVGDYVTIGSATGAVEEMGMRVTKVRDDSGRLNIISNGDISAVTNFSRGEFRVSVDLSVAADTTRERLESAVLGCGPELVSGAPPLRDVRVTGLVAADATKLTFRVEATSRPDERVRGEARLRACARAALVAAGITLA